MSEFKVGDECWTWSLNVYGSYLPFFTKYSITEIIHQERISFACLSHEKLTDTAMSLDLIFKSKQEAIDAMIARLHELKDV